jgi:lysophospholipase L1-like esterase
LGLPFVYAVGKRKNDFEAWNSDILQKVEAIRRLSIEFDALLVDYPKVFHKAIKKVPAEYWIWDGVHPTIFGHELMSREWIKQLGTKWPFLAKKYKY